MKTKKFIIRYMTMEGNIVRTEEEGSGEDDDEMGYNAECKAMEAYDYFKLVDIEETY